MPSYSLPPAALREHWEDVEYGAHMVAMDAHVQKRDTAVVSVYPNGSYFEVNSDPAFTEYETDRVREPRQAISEFTRDSRLRQMVVLAKVDRTKPTPTFLTLTYGDQYPDDWKEWKRHLNEFVKAAQRYCPEVAGMWRLEPQKRMAPHFHLLVWNLRYIPWQWVAVMWACIIHGVDMQRVFGLYRGTKLADVVPMGWGRKGRRVFEQWLAHQDLPEVVKESILCGTRCEKIRTWNGVSCYVAKYMGKESEATFVGVGRFWGVIGRKHMPWAECWQQRCTEREALWIKRIARRWLEAKGVRAKLRGRKLRIVTRDFKLWLRVAELACANATPRPHLVAVSSEEWRARRRAVSAAGSGRDLLLRQRLESGLVALPF